MCSTSTCKQHVCVCINPPPHILKKNTRMWRQLEVGQRNFAGQTAGLVGNTMHLWPRPDMFIVMDRGLLCSLKLGWESASIRTIRGQHSGSTQRPPLHCIAHNQWAAHRQHPMANNCRMLGYPLPLQLTVCRTHVQRAVRNLTSCLYSASGSSTSHGACMLRNSPGKFTMFWAQIAELAGSVHGQQQWTQAGPYAPEVPRQMR